MSQFPNEKPAQDPKRAAESGAIGYNRESDDELRDLELGEGNINPSSQRGGKGGGGAPGMMPPMMGMMGRGGGTPAGGAAGAGAAGAAGMGATGGMPGSVGAPMGAAGAGAGMGGMPGGIGAGGFGAGGLGAGGIGAGGFTPIPRGTIAAGSRDGSEWSPYGINPQFNRPWRPTDPGYPPTSDLHRTTGINPDSYRYTPVPPSRFDANDPRYASGIDGGGFTRINPTSTDRLGRPGVDGSFRPVNPADRGSFTRPDAASGVDAQGLGTGPSGAGSARPVDSSSLGGPGGGIGAVSAPIGSGSGASGGLSGLSGVSGGASGGVSGGGGGVSGGGGGAGGGGGGSYQVSTGDLDNTGSRWDDLSGRMTDVMNKINELMVASAQFGIVNSPAANYGKVVDKAHVSAQSSAENFEQNMADLNTSSRMFEDAEQTNAALAASSLDGNQ